MKARLLLGLGFSVCLLACSDGDESSPATSDAGADNGNPIEPQGSECTADTPCTSGLCAGTSCWQTWTCHLTTVACTADLVDYCGCDGITFQDSSTCPQRPFAVKGACEDGVSCDTRMVTCSTPKPACVDGEVPRVVGNCYDGTCVPSDLCTCTTAADCPADGKFLCVDQRCLPPLMGTVP